MKFRLILVFFLLFFFIFSGVALASGFSLKNVGALTVEGVPYGHLWYTNGNVTFSGSALQSTQVTATIDGQSQTVTADSSGNWSYTASLADGDHNVSFSSDGSAISFVLTIGKDIPENVGPVSSSETPAVGTIGPTIILSLGGSVLLLIPILLKRFNLI